MNEEKKRLHAILKKTGIALTVGLAYALFVRLTGWGIPCIFSVLTGIKCPGCGISRMFLALLELDFAAAARYNLLVLCMLPFALALGIYKTCQYVKTGKTSMGTIEKIFYCVCFALCIVFCVLRNTNGLPANFL